MPPCLSIFQNSYSTSSSSCIRQYCNFRTPESDRAPNADLGFLQKILLELGAESKKNTFCLVLKWPSLLSGKGNEREIIRPFRRQARGPRGTEDWCSINSTLQTEGGGGGGGRYYTFYIFTPKNYPFPAYQLGKIKHARKTVFYLDGQKY